MTSTPEQLLIQAWKKQLDEGLRMMETIIEGSIEVRELQLQAAAQAHADLVATRKAVAAATDAAQLIKLQAGWLQANAEKSFDYWRSAHEALARTQAALAKRGAAEAPLALLDKVAA